MRIRERALLIIVATAALTLPACSRSLNTASIAPAQRVTDWSGIAKLFRDGEVYFGGQPTAEAFEAAPGRGIKVVINLRSEPEVAALDFDEAALVRRLGMRYVAIPVTPNTFGPAHADRLEEVLSDTLGGVLIHCGSSNRVGGVWALYLNRHRGFALDDAIDHGRSAGLRSDKLVEIIRASAAD